MTRTEAVEWQERLFPRRMYREYAAAGPGGPHDVPTNHWRRVPPTLCDICLDVRAGLTGAADPPDTAALREAVAMLKARLDTWADHPGKTDSRAAPGTFAWHDAAVDEAVRQMVRATISMAEIRLREEGGE